MKKTIIILFVTLSLALTACNSDKVQKGISDTAIVENPASNVWDFFFVDVVCSDPGNTMYQCEGK